MHAKLRFAYEFLQSKNSLNLFTVNIEFSFWILAFCLESLVEAEEVPFAT